MVMCRDGEMDAAGPKPCASVQGTTLLVEDLFYNVNTRKQVKRCNVSLYGTQMGSMQYSLRNACRLLKAAAMSSLAFWTLWAGMQSTKPVLPSAASARCYFCQSVLIGLIVCKQTEWLCGVLSGRGTCRHTHPCWSFQT